MENTLKTNSNEMDFSPTIDKIKLESEDTNQNAVYPIETVCIKTEPFEDTDTPIENDIEKSNISSDSINNNENSGADNTDVKVKIEPLSNENLASKSFEIIVKQEPLDEDNKGDEAVDSQTDMKIEVEIAPVQEEVYYTVGHPSSSINEINERNDIIRQNLIKSVASIETRIRRMKNAPKRSYPCEQCNMVFCKKDRLTKHLITHLGLKYNCDICQKQFSSKHNMLRHKNVHTGVKPFSCDHCGKSFVEKHYLAAHLRTHFADKIYACSVCNKEFREKTHLIRHERTHSGERPYTCEVCHKQFKQSAHLSCHRKIHQKKEVLYCDMCKQGFLEKEDLYEHHKVHIGEKAYSCDVCHRQFSQTSHLNDHVRIHNGVRPFSCYLCQKTFAQRSTLNRHIRNHSSDKPYPCPVCQKKFKQKTHVTKHLKLHERDGSINMLNQSCSDSDMELNKPLIDLAIRKPLAMAETEISSSNTNLEENKSSASVNTVTDKGMVEIVVIKTEVPS